ncbi:uncharacterized protein TNCV_3104931 [Trichonephila clavipes]|nr:uncharacterized protein TNCV_3104931 [Trichonephila clavipes]
MNSAFASGGTPSSRRAASPLVKLGTDERRPCFDHHAVAAVAEWSRYRIVAGLVTSSSPVPLKAHCVGVRRTLNLSRAQTSSRWCGVVVSRWGASLGVVHFT